MAHFAKRGPGQEERVLFYAGDCEDGYYSFTARKISQLFAEGNNHRDLLHRMILLMHGLQTGYGTGKYPGKMQDYRFWKQEYPRKYEALITGLTPEALDIIAGWNMHDFTRQVDADLGRQFVAQLNADKALRKDLVIAATTRSQEYVPHL